MRRLGRRVEEVVPFGARGQRLDLGAVPRGDPSPADDCARRAAEGGCDLDNGAKRSGRNETDFVVDAQAAVSKASSSFDVEASSVLCVRNMTGEAQRPCGWAGSDDGNESGRIFRCRHERAPTTRVLGRTDLVAKLADRELGCELRCHSSSVRGRVADRGVDGDHGSSVDAGRDGRMISTLRSRNSRALPDGPEHPAYPRCSCEWMGQNEVHVGTGVDR